MSRSKLFKAGLEILRVITKDSKGFDTVAHKLEMDMFTKEGRCVCRMIVGEEDTNKFGTLHGGMAATLVDIVTTMAIIGANGKPGVSVELATSYMTAAKIGDEITVDAKCSKIGKSLAFATADITLKDNSPVAQGKHTKYFTDSMQSILPADLND